MSEPNPYAAPSTDPSVLRMEVPDGSLWVVSDEELFVRDRAGLPDACVSGSPPGEPGERRSVPIHASRWWVLLVLLVFSFALLAESGIQLLAVIAAGHLASNIGKKIRVMIFESSRGFRRHLMLHRIGSLGSAGFAFWFSEPVFSGQFSESSAILMACCLWWNFPTHRFRAVPHKDGWYELRGVHAKAIARLAEIQQTAEIRQDDIRERRRKR